MSRQSIFINDTIYIENKMANTVKDAIIRCGVNDTVIFNSSTQAARISTDIFDDDFESPSGDEGEEGNTTSSSSS